jgi:hypothetical protein
MLIILQLRVLVTVIDQSYYWTGSVQHLHSRNGSSSSSSSSSSSRRRRRRRIKSEPEEVPSQALIICTVLYVLYVPLQ